MTNHKKYMARSGRACLYSNATKLPPRRLSMTILHAAKISGNDYDKDAWTIGKENDDKEDETTCDDKLLEDVIHTVNRMEMAILKQEPASMSWIFWRDLSPKGSQNGQ